MDDQWLEQVRFREVLAEYPQNVRNILRLVNQYSDNLVSRIMATFEKPDELREGIDFLLQIVQGAIKSIEVGETVHMPSFEAGYNHALAQLAEAAHNADHTPTFH